VQQSDVKKLHQQRHFCIFHSRPKENIKQFDCIVSPAELTRTFHLFFSALAAA
jgi:hypothetical protein